MSWDGKVSENFTARLQRAARNGTGYLEVHDTARERRGWVFLEDQDVVAVLVDGYQPRLARRLIASEFVSVADMGDVLTVTKGEYDPRIAVECVARGLVDPVTMQILYREFMLSAASFMDEWELGDSQWVADVPPWEGRSTAVPVPLLVSALIRRKEHWTRLWTELSTVTIPDRVPVRTGPGGYRPENPDEAAVLRAVNGRRTVDQVAGECGFTRFQTGHLMAALMTKKVLDLFPVNGPESTSSSLRVEAGYYAASEPVPDVDVPAADVRAGGRPPRRVAPPRSWVVPMATSAPRPPAASPDSTDDTTQVAVAGPVAADDPEGNVVTQHVEVEDASADEPQPVDPAEVFPPATNLGEFFVSSPLPPAAVEDRPPATAVVQHDLPPLPVITGRPSDFYAVPPSTLPRRPGGLLVKTLPGWPMARPVAEPVAVAEPLAEPLAAGSDPMSPGEAARVQQKPELDAEGEAAAGLDVERDMEVTRLRDELLRLATERKAAAEQAVVLHEQAVLHSAHADAAAILVEEADRSVARLTMATSEASAKMVNHFEGLLLARHEDARVAALRAQLDEDAEKASKALALGQHDFDESSAVHANLERDLQVEMAALETVHEAWTAATDGAVRSAADVRHAEAAAAECDQRFEEAHERLTEIANCVPHPAQHAGRAQV